MIDVRGVRGHYEVFENGKFLFSADTLFEVNKELEELENGRANDTKAEQVGEDLPG